MFEKERYHCPVCEAAVQHKIEDKSEFKCYGCDRRFRVLLDKEADKVAFIEISTVPIPEPLYLPRGSIRAIVTLLTAASSWILIFGSRYVPPFILFLLLMMIGYYFGFRKRIKSAQSRIFDPTAKGQEPLFLPAGTIRVFIIGGFICSGAFLYLRGMLDYVPFFAILSGLVVGYGFGKFFSKSEGNMLLVSINHLKGLVVLVAAFYLAILLIGGGYADSPGRALILSCVISFYFGTRS